MKTIDITEDGIYILHSGKFVTVWVRATRANEDGHLVGVWRNVQDWTGASFNAEDLDAYKVAGKLKLGQPYTVMESYVC